MSAYHYHCANCYCTLYADHLPKGETYFHITNGELCSSCQAKEEAWADDDDD